MWGCDVLGVHDYQSWRALFSCPYFGNRVTSVFSRHFWCASTTEMYAQKVRQRSVFASDSDVAVATKEVPWRVCHRINVERSVLFCGHSAVFSFGHLHLHLWVQLSNLRILVRNSSAHAILLRGCPKLDCICRGGVFGIPGFGIR